MAASRDPEVVRALFGELAPRYDTANHWLSAGCDFYWRRRAAEIVAGWRPSRVLDLATGSGDLALAVQRLLPQTKVTGADFSPEMLARAREKGLRETVVADALKLPFADQAFDAVTVAFGLRNMRDWSAALREMQRVLTPAGYLLVLEFSIPADKVLRALYRFYLHNMIPPLARLITNQQPAYAYLGESIESFPSDGKMCRLIAENGFIDPKAQPLTGGIVTIYTARAAAAGSVASD